MIDRSPSQGDPFSEAIDRVEKLRQARQNEDISAEISAQLKQASHPEERKGLFSALAGELSMHRRDSEAERVLNRMISEFPEDERVWIKISNHYLYSENDLSKALPAIDRALNLARRSERFLREACGVKARIGLALGDTGVLSAAVDEIVRWGPRRDVVDIGVERDFVDRAPEGAINRALLSSFEDLYESYWTK